MVKVSCLFTACSKCFTEKFPGDFTSAELPKILKAFPGCNAPKDDFTTTVGLLFTLRFLAKHCDADLLAMLQDSVPPVDLERVSVFRSACKKFEKKVASLIVAHPF